jgi:hypothetical protein
MLRGVGEENRNHDVSLSCQTPPHNGCSQTPLARIQKAWLFSKAVRPWQRGATVGTASTLVGTDGRRSRPCDRAMLGRISSLRCREVLPYCNLCSDCGNLLSQICLVKAIQSRLDTLENRRILLACLRAPHLQKVIAEVRAKPRAAYDVEAVAAFARMSRSALAHEFLKAYGMTPM